MGGRFWATVPVLADGSAVEIAAASGSAVAPLGRIAVVPREPPPTLGTDSPGLIAICMATFEPDPALFHAQVESLRAQTDTDWVCVVSDDASAPEHLERIRAELGTTTRASCSRPRRSGGASTATSSARSRSHRPRRS